MRRASASLFAEEHEALVARMRGVDPLTQEGAIGWRAFDLLYASRLLTDGYGFADDTASIEFRGEIGGAEVEWTLGALHDYLSHEGVNSRRAAKSAMPALPEPSTDSDWLGSVAFLGLGVAVLYVLKRRFGAPRLARASSRGYLGVETRSHSYP